jgi:ribonuclease Z
MDSSIQTKITILGTTSAIPPANNDTASFLINDHILVDTGWAAFGNLRKLNIEPLTIDYLIFTHMHHDHYLALPHFLFYQIMKKRNLEEIRIIGPAEDVERVVKLALDFLQVDRFFADRSSSPTVIPIEPGETYEDDSFVLQTSLSKHPVQALCSKFTDKLTGKCFSFTGDTGYHPPLADHIKGSSLLIHDCTWGGTATNPDEFLHHSGAIDAGRIAQAAGVETLLMVHGSDKKGPESVEAAKQVFDGQAVWPHPGQTFIL